MVFWMMRSSQYLGSSFFQFDGDIVINHKPYMPQGLWVLNFETACHCTNPLHQPRNLCSAQHNSNANCASIGGPANPGECHLVQDFNWDHTTPQWWDEDSKNLQPGSNWFLFGLQSPQGTSTNRFLMLQARPSLLREAVAGRERAAGCCGLSTMPCGPIPIRWMVYYENRPLWFRTECMKDHRGSWFSKIWNSRDCWVSVSGCGSGALFTCCAQPKHRGGNERLELPNPGTWTPLGWKAESIFVIEGWQTRRHQISFFFIPSAPIRARNRSHGRRRNSTTPRPGGRWSCPGFSWCVGG